MGEDSGEGGPINGQKRSRREALWRLSLEPPHLNLLPPGEKRLLRQARYRVCTLTPNHGLAHHLQELEERKKGKEPDSDALVVEREQQFVDAANELLERARVPTTPIDITDVIHKKYSAMNKFKSQYYGYSSPLQRKLTEAVDVSVAGINRRVPHAQSFISHYPQVYESLPISEYYLEISRKSVADKFNYMSQVLLDG